MENDMETLGPFKGYIRRILGLYCIGTLMQVPKLPVSSWVSLSYRTLSLYKEPASVSLFIHFAADSPHP